MLKRPPDDMLKRPLDPASGMAGGRGVVSLPPRERGIAPTTVRLATSWMADSPTDYPRNPLVQYQSSLASASSATARREFASKAKALSAKLCRC